MVSLEDAFISVLAFVAGKIGEYLKVYDYGEVMDIQFETLVWTSAICNGLSSSCNVFYPILSIDKQKAIPANW